MSYDLFFMLPKDSNLDAAKQYFSKRAHYSVLAEQADFTNQDTENGFIVDFIERGDPDLPWVTGQHVVFRINFFRPRTYLLEVIPELEAFNTAFKCVFFNETSDKVESFDIQSFCASWLKTNSFAVRKFSDEGGYNSQFASSTQVENAWRWNHQLGSMRDFIGENAYIPKVMWLKLSNKTQVQTFVTWTDAIPIIFPKFCDFVLIMRDSATTSPGTNDEAENKAYKVSLISIDEIKSHKDFKKVELGGWTCLQHKNTGSEEIALMFANSNYNMQDLFDLIDPSLVFEDDMASNL
jgi:hypothetical protein